MNVANPNAVVDSANKPVEQSVVNSFAQCITPIISLKTIQTSSNNVKLNYHMLEVHQRLGTQFRDEQGERDHSWKATLWQRISKDWKD